MARWNGQTRGDWPYSVAEHSLLVEEIFSRMNQAVDSRWRLAALLHDAPEYVIGDMISPVKSALGSEYKAMDERLTIAIHRRFGLPATLPAAIKKKIKMADRISARLEAVQIAGFTDSEARKLFPLPNELFLSDLTINLRPPADVRIAYLEKFNVLLNSTDQS